MGRRPRVQELGLLGLIMLLVVACGGGGGQAKTSSSPATTAVAAKDTGIPAALADAIAAAKKEKLLIVGHPGDNYDALMQAFQKTYPDIPVEYSGLRPSEFTPKMLVEQKNGVFNWDVWWDATSTMTNVAMPAGAFQDLAPYLISPDVKDPKNWRGGKILYTSEKTPVVFIHSLVLPGGVYVNRDIAPKDILTAGKPLDLDQLLDPRLKGKILFRTPASPEGGSLFLTGVLKAKGPAFLKKLLVDQQPIYQENAVLISQQIIQGKGAIEIGGDQPTLQKCKLEGGCKNIDEVIQQVYALGTGVGVFKNAPHPNASKVFVNWILSKEGQQAFVDAWYKYHQPGGDSDRVDVEPRDPDHAIDFSKLDQVSLQGTESGNDLMNEVLRTYKEISSK